MSLIDFRISKIYEFPDLTQCGSDSFWIQNGRCVPPEEQEGGAYEGQAGQGDLDDEKNDAMVKMYQSNFWQSLYMRWYIDLCLN